MYCLADSYPICRRPLLVKDNRFLRLLANLICAAVGRPKLTLKVPLASIVRHSLRVGDVPKAVVPFKKPATAITGWVAD